MDLQLAAELISAFAALVTVVMAVMELYSRGSSKKAENAVDVYAEYLYIAQQLEYSICNIEKLIESADSMKDEEIKAFVQTHILGDDFLVKLQKIENTSIKTFNYTKDIGRKNSKSILTYTGDAINLRASINTFFISIADSNKVSRERIAEIAPRIIKEYTDMRDTSAEAGEILKNNLKTWNKMSLAYVVLLFALSLLFTIVSFLCR